LFQDCCSKGENESTSPDDHRDGIGSPKGSSWVNFPFTQSFSKASHHASDRWLFFYLSKL
ncbi:MAG: hypothetical protein KW802_04210, partial [Candidatus Doudnabacteria bacterium]|nr:hypothetical protein [Candidatus Doudnabacteria bacterium]